MSPSLSDGKQWSVLLWDLQTKQVTHYKAHCEMVQCFAVMWTLQWHRETRSAKRHSQLMRSTTYKPSLGNFSLCISSKPVCAEAWSTKQPVWVQPLCVCVCVSVSAAAFNLRFYLGSSWSVSVNDAEFLENSAGSNQFHNHQQIVCNINTENPTHPNLSNTTLGQRLRLMRT